MSSTNPSQVICLAFKFAFGGEAVLLAAGGAFEVGGGFVEFEATVGGELGAAVAEGGHFWFGHVFEVADDAQVLVEHFERVDSAY